MFYKIFICIIVLWIFFIWTTNIVSDLETKVRRLENNLKLLVKEIDRIDKENNGQYYERGNLDK